MQNKNFLKLRGAVAAKGTTLKELAETLGITQQSLTAKLYGRKQFTLGEVIKACNFLESPVDIFFDPDLHNLQFIGIKKAE